MGTSIDSLLEEFFFFFSEEIEKKVCKSWRKRWGIEKCFKLIQQRNTDDNAAGRGVTVGEYLQR